MPAAADASPAATCMVTFRSGWSVAPTNSPFALFTGRGLARRRGMARGTADASPTATTRSARPCCPRLFRLRRGRGRETPARLPPRPGFRTWPIGDRWRARRRCRGAEIPAVLDTRSSARGLVANRTRTWRRRPTMPRILSRASGRDGGHSAFDRRRSLAVRREPPRHLPPVGVVFQSGMRHPGDGPPFPQK